MNSPAYPAAYLTTTFITPASIITTTGFNFVLRSSNRQIPKITTIDHFVAANCTIPPVQNAVRKIAIPADAISATTAGLSDSSTLWNIFIFLYLK